MHAPSTFNHRDYGIHIFTQAYFCLLNKLPLLLCHAWHSWQGKQYCTNGTDHVVLRMCHAITDNIIHRTKDTHSIMNCVTE